MHKNMFEKFFHFAHDVIENHEELGLSRDAVQKVIDLKINTKKQMIKDAAEIELATVDIFVELWSEKTGTAEVNKLLDKKYEIKKESMKRFVESFMALKKMLTPEQMKKVKAICKSHSGQMEKKETCCK
jgi:Spy/CpxP family protein refolding chaperone